MFGEKDVRHRAAPISSAIECVALLNTASSIWSTFDEYNFVAPGPVGSPMINDMVQFTSMTRLAYSSTHTRQSGGSTVVELYSVMSAGPANVSPLISKSRWYTLLCRHSSAKRMSRVLTTACEPSPTR